jgi:undecaprenyl-diphosphatase
MSFWLAIILGLAQGLTEFLPVSSSGHLTFFELILGMEQGSVLYNIILHVATLMALVIVMWRDIWEIVRHPLDKYMRMLLLSTILTGFVGIFVDKLVGAEGNLLIVAIGFIATAGLLAIVQVYQKSKKYCPLSPVGYKQAFAVGIMQGIAVLPGLSRSGSTLAAGVLSGADSNSSAKFSFLLSIPIILGGMLYEIYNGASSGFGFSSADILPMAVGFVVAFVSALATLKIMLKLVSKNKWHYFVIYLLLFAAAIIIFGSVCGCLV